jgi:hypothetical protein
VVVVQDAERARADGADRMVPAAATAASSGCQRQLEPGTAGSARERRGSRIDSPGSRQAAVEVLQELAQQIGGACAGKPRGAQQRDGVRALLEIERADGVVVEDLEGGPANALRIALGVRRARDSGKTGRGQSDDERQASPMWRIRAKIASAAPLFT